MADEINLFTKYLKIKLKNIVYKNNEKSDQKILRTKQTFITSLITQENIFLSLCLHTL